MTTLLADLPGPTLLQQAVRNRWKLIVIAGLLGALLGAVYAVGKPASYTSTSEIIVQPLAGNPFSPDALVNSQQITVGLTTEANLVDSAQVAQLAGMPDAAKNVSAEVLLNSQLIQISYTAPSREAAQKGAEAFAQGLLDYRKSLATQLRNQHVASLDPQLASVGKTLRNLNLQLAQPSPPPGAGPRSQLLTLRLSDLQQSMADAKSQSTYPGSVVVPATLPADSQFKHTLILFVLGGVLGAGLGFAIAVFRTWVDDRIDSRTVTRVAGVPVWATLHAPDRHRPDDGVIEELSEEYRQVRAALLTNAPSPRVIALTGTYADQDTSRVCLNLASCVASAGFQVTVVDVTPGGRLSQELGLSDAPGLSEVIQGRPLDETLQVADDLWLLPAGISPDLEEDLAISREFRSIVRQLREGTDYVFLVTPPADSSVGLACAAVADTLVLIAVDRQTTHEHVQQQADHLTNNRLSIDGIVLTARRPRLPGFGNVADVVVAEGDAPVVVDAERTDADLSADHADAGRTLTLAQRDKSGDVGKSA